MPQLPATIGDVAKLFAEANPSEQVSFYARRLRHWAAAGLLVGDVARLGEGINAAFVLTRADIVACRIFHFLANLGLDTPALAEVRSCMWSMDRPTALAATKAHGHVGDGGVGFVASRIAAGDAGWKLRLRLDDNGQVVAGGWTRGDDDTVHSVWRRTATLTVDVSRLCRGLFGPAEVEGA